VSSVGKEVVEDEIVASLVFAFFLAIDAPQLTS